MKKLTALILVLAMVLTFAACGCKHEWLAATCENPKTCELCGKTMGTPRDHSFVDATCEEVRHCEYCDEKFGLEPLGHNWAEATTEEPMTCRRCGATEGERIITDPRFTTADTSHLHGKWIMEIPFDGELMGIADFPSGASICVTMTFGKAGELTMEYGVTDNFMDMLLQYSLDTMYSAYAEQGIDAATADAMFESTYGMSMQAYMEQSLEDTDLSAVLETMFETADMSGVYYVDKGVLYTGENWDAEMTRDGFLDEYNTLKIESIAEVLGDDFVFTRVKE